MYKETILTGLLLLAFGMIIINGAYKPAMAEMELMEWNYVKYSKSLNLSLRSPNLSLTNNNTKQYEIISETIREVTAYNVGDSSQCSGNPCISASGINICKALERGGNYCAANFVKFGTILNISSFGNCMVVDRMNSRYPQRVDIAMRLDEKERALKFGIQKLKVSIIK